MMSFAFLSEEADEGSSFDRDRLVDMWVIDRLRAMNGEKHLFSPGFHIGSSLYNNTNRGFISTPQQAKNY